MIKLGQKVEDRITRFSGIVTGRVEYITGCHQVLVAPRSKPEGELIASQWFDEDRMKVIVEKPISLSVTKAGFDKAAPVR